MEHIAICIAILLWLIRPQDWMSGMAGVGFMTWVMLAAIVGVARRPDGTQWRTYFRSPCDWIVLAYLLWIIWTSGEWFATAKALVPFAGFYYVTAVALNTTKRLSAFISCWVAGLAVATLFALSTPWGFEMAPGSRNLTEYFVGRLALNTWIFNNPNALGHGVVALLPLGYVWLIWRRPVGLRILGILIIAAAIDCVIQTESKGAYLCGAAAACVALIYRKPRIVQIFMVAVFMTAGIGALKLLPRMDTLDHKEAGIAGRLLIWQMAYNAMESTVRGEGWKKFEAWIDTEEYGLIRKATHGSYVNVGADLGYMGLLLFVGVLYANSKTLFLAKPEEDDLEADRCQRALLSLTASFAASAWMIDRAYHTDFFILAGAVSAYHRMMTGGHIPIVPKPEPEMPTREFFPAMTASMGLPQPALSTAGPVMALHQTSVSHIEPSPVQTADSSDKAGTEEAETEGAQSWGLKWRRLNVVDLIMMVAACATVIYLWQKLMTSFISF